MSQTRLWLRRRTGRGSLCSGPKRSTTWSGSKKKLEGEPDADAEEDQVRAPENEQDADEDVDEVLVCRVRRRA